LAAIVDDPRNEPEATEVEENFASLSSGRKQELLNFLRLL
jgi:hypothetical protein